MVVGRGLSSDIALYDPTISRRHAELIARADGVQVKDLGSSNGTFVNGARVTSARIAPDDAVTFGRLMFHLKALPQPVDADPPGSAGGMIVRQVLVTGGAPPGVTSRDGPGSAGQLRVDAASAEARQATKLSMLLEISQKLSGEFDLDRLLRTVVDMTFEIMNVDRVTILLRDETSGELVPTISRTKQGDVHPQRCLARSPTRWCGRASRSSPTTLRPTSGSRVSRSGSRACGAPCALPSWPRPIGSSACSTSTTIPRPTPSPTRISSFWSRSAAWRRSASRTAGTPTRSGAKPWCAPISSATSLPMWPPRSPSRPVPFGSAGKRRARRSCSATSAASPRWPRRWGPTRSLSC